MKYTKRDIKDMRFQVRECLKQLRCHSPLWVGIILSYIVWLERKLKAKGAPHV